MTSAGEFEIVSFDANTHGDLIPELTAMLHESYKPLAEAGMSFWAATQPEDMTLSRLQGGNSFFGFYDGQLIATITVAGPDPDDVCKWYRKPGVNHFTQFCVRHQFKGQGFGDRMLAHAENHARSNGGVEMSLDTSERAERLIKTYSNRGYRFVEKTKWPNTNYESVVMSKSLNNVLA